MISKIKIKFINNKYKNKKKIKKHLKKRKINI